MNTVHAGSVPQELLHDTWATLDADGSGDVDYAEFEAYMRSYGLEVTYT
jgi:Ca2+-binding EF-hand superfamily protein|eukprot:COSAG06_NODE_208_length_20182_cov_31.214759_3_plen_49_part_00